MSNTLSSQLHQLREGITAAIRVHEVFINFLGLCLSQELGIPLGGELKEKEEGERRGEEEKRRRGEGGKGEGGKGEDLDFRHGRCSCHLKKENQQKKKEWVLNDNLCENKNAHKQPTRMKKNQPGKMKTFDEPSITFDKWKRKTKRSYK